jgi:5-formyltetrahydrofolate cyclo-ligase
MTKAEIRRDYREKIKFCKPTNKKIYDVIIQNRVVSDRYFLRAKSVFVYLSVHSEVATELIIEEAFKAKKRVFVPVMDGTTMSSAEIFPDTEYTLNKFGIKEPVAMHNAQFTMHNEGMAIVPMIAFDANLNRIGQGLGCYDRFLADFDGAKIGVAYSFQLVDNIDTLPTDVPLDRIYTEYENYSR